MRMNAKKSKSIAPKLIAAALIAVVIVGGWLTYAYAQKTWPFQNKIAEEPSQINQDGINYSPPTDEEVKEGQDAKGDIVSGDRPPAISGDKDNTPVAISFADMIDGNLEIRAFISSIIEGSGTCTARVSHAGTTVSGSAKAFVDASSSICRPIRIPEAKLKTGEWSVIVTYSSVDAAGTSEIVKVAVP